MSIEMTLGKKTLNGIQRAENLSYVNYYIELLTSVLKCP